MLSIIIPVRNEVEYIEEAIESFIQDTADKEIWICDTGSTDGTLQILNSLALKYEQVKIFNSQHKSVSKVFNEVFPLTKGEYISLLGAHAKYSSHYFSTGIKYLQNNECDSIGGPLIQQGQSKMGKAIAYCMSSKFGVGNTPFRTEIRKMFVETVAFSIFKRELIQKVGLFDEDLVRNQDAEFNYRLNANGYKILMVPELTCYYFVRETLPALTKQYYQYGYYKPLVFKKLKGSVKPRHIVPAIFILYLLGLVIGHQYSIYCVPLIVYFLSVLFFSIKNSLTYRQKMNCLVVFPALHLSYGIGYLVGAFKFKNMF
jgi:glycosyltransferase involved in cell wall biosynthesis